MLSIWKHQSVEGLILKICEKSSPHQLDVRRIHRNRGPRSWEFWCMDSRSNVEFDSIMFSVEVLNLYLTMNLFLQSLGVPGPVGNEDLSKKKKKDPNRLKKPKSAFLLWCKEHRQTVCPYYCRMPLFSLKISKEKQQTEVLGYSINWNFYCCYAWNISNSFVLRFS